MYIIIIGDQAPFLTDYLLYDNFEAQVGIIAIRVSDMKFTMDGETWQEMDTDHL